MSPGEEVDEVYEHEVEQGDVTAEQEHRDDHYYRGIRQFLVLFEASLRQVPWPGRFLELDLHFVEEIFCFGDHFEKLNRDSLNRYTVKSLKRKALIHLDFLAI
jgi:hypothetical protein